MNPCLKFAVLTLVSLCAGLTSLQAQISIAILPFQDKGEEVSGEGDRMSDLLFAFLSEYPDYFLVEREDLELALDEQGLSQTPLVNPGEAVRLGHITGAKLLVTGSVVEAGRQKFLIAKLISSETSRVVGASVKGPLKQDTAALAEQLAEKIATTLEERAEQILPKAVPPEDREEQLRAKLAGKHLPPLVITVKESHVGWKQFDPTAQTELERLSLAVGFPVKSVLEDGAVEVIGQAFSEPAGKRGTLIFAKARVELKALNANGDVIAVDRQTHIAADLAENVAAKKALQEAAVELANRFLPRLAVQETP